MKNRINRLARGVYEYDMPSMAISVTSISEVIPVEDIFTGEVRIFSEDNRAIKGIMYSDNVYVTVVNSNFTAMDNLIQYKVNTMGLKVNDVISGTFEIVSDAGERKITYEFTMREKGFDTSIGLIKNMFHFANYVQTDYDKALKLFLSEQFKTKLLCDDDRLSAFYDSVIVSKDMRAALEEFLVETKKKAKISISVDSTSKYHEKVTEDIEDKITIVKDNWGYVKIKIQADMPFIKLKANNIDSDAFSGNSYDLVYHIDASKLHAGKNYGRLSIITDGKVINVDITVANEGAANREQRFLIKNAQLRLVRAYIKFRTRFLSARGWIDESLHEIEVIRKLDDSNPFYKLAMAHLFLADKKETKAQWLIESTADDIMAIKDKNMPVYCYYLYVKSLLGKDKLLAIKTMEQIKSFYEGKYDDWRILWILLYLDDENDRNKTLKLTRLKEQYYKGCKSPVMYLEACMIFNETPGYLRVLDEFEMQVLSYGCKHELFLKKATDYICNMINKLKVITPLQIKLLMNLYKTYESDEILVAICEALIRNECVGKSYFSWYSLGVEKELKITKLYEYYVRCIDNSVMNELPKTVLLYFMYNSDIDYRAKAYVYACVTHNRGENPSMFENYRKDIGLFAINQLKYGHIDDNLAIIYANILREDMINEENKINLPKILFTYKIVCDNPNIIRVIVRHKENNNEVIYSVNNGVSYVQLYTREPVIIFETSDGVRYNNNISYSIRRLLDEDNFKTILISMVDENQNMALHFASRAMDRHDISADSRELYIKLLKNPNVTKSFKELIFKLMIDYYYDAYDVDNRYNTLLTTISQVSLDREYMSKMLEILISNGEYIRAYDFIDMYHIYPVNPKRIYRLTTKILLMEHQNDDEILINLSDMCLRNRKYDDNILIYLVNNYNRSTKDMITLWELANNYGIDTVELSERIIAQSVFTRTHNKMIYTIFENYYNYGVNERVIEAYISYNCYNYFVRESIINEDILSIVEHRYLYGMDILPVCQMALLYYYSSLDSLNEKQVKAATTILEELVGQEVYFAFYKALIGKLNLPYEIIDKSYVEYRTTPNAKVTIHYIYEDGENNKSYTVEEMKNSYEGIFVKPFVLFYGQAVQYYIVENKDGIENVTESRRLVNTTINPNLTDSRFDAINDIFASIEVNDTATMKKLIHGYAVKEYITKEMFMPR